MASIRECAVPCSQALERTTYTHVGLSTWSLAHACSTEFQTVVLLTGKGWNQFRHK